MEVNFAVIIKKIINLTGFDICKLSNSSRHNLVGLKKIPIKSIIDIGANKGQFARKISNVFPHSLIYCFEPLPGPFHELKKWAESQNGKVLAYNMALGESEGHVEMLEHIDHSPSSSLLKTTETCTDHYPFTERQLPVLVPLTTLDKMVNSMGQYLDPDILIKIDVQGYEKHVLNGGAEIFQKARVCIIEVNLDRLYEGQPTFKDILLKLSEYGYTYAGNLEQSYAKDGHVIFIDAVFIKK